MGRLDDVSIDSTEVLAGIVAALRPAGVTSEVLAASIRHPEHVVTAAKLGCEVATAPGKVLRAMLDHPLTSSGIERFNADWRSRPEFGAWLAGISPEPSPRRRRARFKGADRRPLPRRGRSPPIHTARRYACPCSTAKH